MDILWNSSPLSNILQKNGNDSEKMETIQPVNDETKVVAHTKQKLNVWKKMCFFFSKQCKDLLKFAEDADSHIFEEELEDSIKERERETLQHAGFEK